MLNLDAAGGDFTGGSSAEEERREGIRGWSSSVRSE